MLALFVACALFGAKFFLLPCDAIPIPIAGGGLRNCVYDAYVEAEVARVRREADGLSVCTVAMLRPLCGPLQSALPSQNGGRGERGARR